MKVSPPPHTHTYFYLCLSSVDDMNVNIEYKCRERETETETERQTDIYIYFYQNIFNSSHVTNVFQIAYYPLRSFIIHAYILILLFAPVKSDVRNNRTERTGKLQVALINYLFFLQLIASSTYVESISPVRARQISEKLLNLFDDDVRRHTPPVDVTQIDVMQTQIGRHVVGCHVRKEKLVDGLSQVAGNDLELVGQSPHLLWHVPHLLLSLVDGSHNLFQVPCVAGQHNQVNGNLSLRKITACV